MEGYVYSVATNKAGLYFTRTTNKIAWYAGEKYSAIKSYIQTVILTMMVQVPAPLTAPGATRTPPTLDAVDQAMFKEEIQQFVKERADIVTTMKAVLIWGQCSKSSGLD
jgi:hypothetical protein